MVAGAQAQMKIRGMYPRDDVGDLVITRSTPDLSIPCDDYKLEIVRVALERVWSFADDVYKKANYILRRSAQKHPEGQRIWQREFMGPDTVRQRVVKLMNYRWIFAVDMSLWGELYQMLTEEFPKLKEVTGKTTEKALDKYLRVWYKEFDTTEKRPFSPGEHLQWDKRIDADVMNESARNGGGKKESENEEDKDQNEDGEGERDEEEEDRESPPEEQLANMHISDE